MNVDEQIKIIDKSICKEIENYHILNERGFLSQEILSKLRHFVEAICNKISGEKEHTYDNFKLKSKNFISSKGEFNFLIKFHNQLQKTVSHYVKDEESSERLMLKYYEYLFDIKLLLGDKFELNVLENLEKFPLHLDPALQEYYEKIAYEIENQSSGKKYGNYYDRYYITKIKPFFINQKKYYEVTFTTAKGNENRFDRTIAFTKRKILPNYSVKLDIREESIKVFDKKMPIQIIDNWEVSIRPCELNNFAKIFIDEPKINYASKETNQLMFFLTKSGFNLVEVINFEDKIYEIFKSEAIKGTKTNPIFNILDKARKIIKNKSEGHNVLRYLLYNLNNKIIKHQYNHEKCSRLSNLKLKWGCIPFDEMPFVTSLIQHNPKIFNLIDCINVDEHKYELLPRLIKNNIEQRGMLYTNINEMNNIENIESIIKYYNNKIYAKHKPARNLEIYKNHLYINEYEQDTVKIIKKLKELSQVGIKSYPNTIDSWLNTSTSNVDCENKKEVLRTMFENSHVALIYGAAGTGKTRLIEHLSSFFHNYKKLFLANTNPAINNLKSRIETGNSEFRTIASFLSSSYVSEYDVLIIDECSTISNSDMLKILNKGSFRLLVLVGDIFQIESILFGNWFGISKFFIPKTSYFELTKPYRTNNDNLVKFWDKVRNIENNILEHIVNNNYSTNLDETIFDSSEEDEIILCLNYDGLYGINNINKFLQANNENESVRWGIHNYKVGDPVLFNDSSLFKPLIHNNLKGKIVDIKKFDDRINFTIEIYKTINEFDASEYDFEFINVKKNGNSVISFDINKMQNSDDDKQSLSDLVPFQVAYAISIHKAQGLEYNSVKIVITNEVEEMISHNIFYTSITRAKKKLKIYWTPETENYVLSNLKHKINNKDINLLKVKFNL